MLLLESLIDCLFGGENGPGTIIRNTSFRREPFSVKRPLPTEGVGGLNYCVFDILISHQAPFKSFYRGRNPAFGGCILADVGRPYFIAFSFGFLLDGRPIGIFSPQAACITWRAFWRWLQSALLPLVRRVKFDQARWKLASRGHCHFQIGSSRSEAKSRFVLLAEDLLGPPANKMHSAAGRTRHRVVLIFVCILFVTQPMLNIETRNGTDENERRHSGQKE